MCIHIETRRKETERSLRDIRSTFSDERSSREKKEKEEEGEGGGGKRRRARAMTVCKMSTTEQLW